MKKGRTEGGGRGRDREREKEREVLQEKQKYYL